MLVADVPSAGVVPQPVDSGAFAPSAAAAAGNDDPDISPKLDAFRIPGASKIKGKKKTQPDASAASTDAETRATGAARRAAAITAITAVVVGSCLGSESVAAGQHGVSQREFERRDRGGGRGPRP